MTEPPQLPTCPRSQPVVRPSPAPKASHRTRRHFAVGCSILAKIKVNRRCPCPLVGADQCPQLSRRWPIRTTTPFNRECRESHHPRNRRRRPLDVRHQEDCDCHSSRCAGLPRVGRTVRLSPATISRSSQRTDEGYQRFHSGRDDHEQSANARRRTCMTPRRRSCLG